MKHDVIKFGEGENVFRVLPGGEKVKYESTVTIHVLKNRNDGLKFPNKPVIPTKIEEFSTQFLGPCGTEMMELPEFLDVVGNNPVVAAELKELCEAHDEWSIEENFEINFDAWQTFSDPEIEDKIGEAGLPDMAANAAMLREQLRVETNVRLALSEKQDAQNPFFAEDPNRYTMKDVEYYKTLMMRPKLA